MTNDTTWLDQISWDSNGLVPAIAQEKETGKVLTLGWMNQDTLKKTVLEGRAVYWSRSRNKIWRKGEKSGYVQWVDEIRIDCDKDAILLTVRQDGGVACHTGRHNCFYMKLHKNEWDITDPVIKDPKKIYKNK